MRFSAWAIIAIGGVAGCQSEGDEVAASRSGDGLRATCQAPLYDIPTEARITLDWSAVTMDVEGEVIAEPGRMDIRFYSLDVVGDELVRACADGTLADHVDALIAMENTLDDPATSLTLDVRQTLASGRAGTVLISDSDGSEVAYGLLVADGAPAESVTVVFSNLGAAEVGGIQ